LTKFDKEDTFMSEDDEKIRARQRNISESRKEKEFAMV